MGRSDVYEDPDATDPVLPRDIVRELAGGFLPDREVPERFEIDESGGEARAYFLGEDIVVKTQRPHRRRPRTSLRKEASVLELLATSLGDRIPRLHGHGMAETEVGAVEFLVMSRVVGRAVLHQSVTGVARDQLLTDVAEALRSIHAADLNETHAQALLPDDSDENGEAAGALDRRFRDWFADLLEVFAEHPGRWNVSVSPEDMISAALAALPKSLIRPAVLVHSNPGPTHLFVDTAGAFTGMIDFGDAYRSHPALDLRGWPNPADRVGLHAAYLGSHSADAEFDAVWTVAMIHADMAAIARQADHAEAAERDLALRLSSL